MPDYIRPIVPGGTIFFTVITYNRRPIFRSTSARKILRTAMLDVAKRFPYETDAICLLPNHIHCIWTLPENDSDYSIRWKEIKRIFSKTYNAEVQKSTPTNKSRVKREELAIWQRRFWEHIIRNELDYNNHINYIHYNPVKHGLVKQVSEWPWSSFHRYVKDGFYESEWGSNYEEIGFNFGE